MLRPQEHELFQTSVREPAAPQIEEGRHGMLRLRSGQERRLRRAENEPEQLGVEEEDGCGDDPGDDSGQARVREFAHPIAVPCELDQRDNREGQLKTENHLTENEQRSHLIFAGNANDQYGGNDGKRAGNEPAEPGPEANVKEAFHDDLACKRAGEGGVLAGGKQGAGEKRAGKAGAEDGAEEFVGIGDLSDVTQPAGVESGGAKNEDRGIDKKRKPERDCRIEYSITYSFTPIADGGAKSPRLDDAGVKIKIVRHDGRAKDANGDVEHFAVAKDFRPGDESDGGFAPKRMSKKDFVSETKSDRSDERDDEGFDQAEASTLQRENNENVQGSDENTGKKRQAEEKLQCDGGSQDLGEVTGGDSNFADHPKEEGGPAGIVFAAGLSEVTTRRNPKLRRKGLQEHRHQVADEDDAEE